MACISFGGSFDLAVRSFADELLSMPGPSSAEYASKTEAQGTTRPLAYYVSHLGAPRSMSKEVQEV